MSIFKLSPPPPPNATPQAPPPVTYASSAVREGHLLDRLGIIYKHQRVAFSVFFLIIVGAAVHTYTTVPVYRAQARVLIEAERQGLEGLGEREPVYYDMDAYFETQLRILEGRALAQRVVARIGLTRPDEITGRTPPPSGFSAVVVAAREALSVPLTWSMGSTAEPEEPSEETARSTTARESALVRALLGQMLVRAVRDTRLVDILFDSTDPQFAAEAANAFAEEYVAQNLEAKLQANNRTLDWLNGELERQKANLESSERALADYRDAENALSLGGGQNIIVSRLNQLNDQLTRAKTVRIQKEALYNQVKSLDPSDADAFPAILQNSYIQTVKARLAELQRDKSRLGERYLERHPEIQRVDGLIEEASQQLSAELRKAVSAVESDYLTALAEEQSLTEALQQSTAEAQDLSRKGIDYGVLERQAQTDREVYQTLLSRENELTVESNSRSNNARLMDRAEMPTGPFIPDPWRNMFIATVLGLTLSLSLVFALEYFDDTIKTPEEVTQKLKLPFLGLVPAVRGNKGPLLLGAAPHDFAEAYRALRTSLVFSSGSEEERVIAVTSTQPLEGKTTSACNLATVLAVGGARVLLIDADLRRPSVHDVLGLNNSIGLSHLLVGQARVRDVVQRTSDPNLYVISAGLTPPNPADLLSSQRMKHFISSLGSGPFDWVVVDTPPVLAVTDAVIIAPLVSGVVVVLGAQMTRQRLAERAVEMLQSSRPHILGVILNRVDFARDKYYYSRYYGYQYKSYYGHSTATSA